MKVILSRKGFDTQYGGQPSPILPDGTLLSLPIPLPGENIKYNELVYKDKTYLEIIQELYPNTKQIDIHTTAHLDPDIREGIYRQQHPQWQPAFGQCDAAQGTLRNKNVSVNDLFLFFGWFRQTALINGKLNYKKGAPDLHIIYGYLQVGAIYEYGKPFPAWTIHHPHCMDKYKNVKSNCIYVAKDNLSFNPKLKGAGCLQFNPNLVLTKEGMSKSKWQLPPFFKSLNIAYHNENCFKEDHFQSRARGQEFVIEANELLTGWAKALIENN